MNDQIIAEQVCALESDEITATSEVSEAEIVDDIVESNDTAQTPKLEEADDNGSKADEEIEKELKVLRAQVTELTELLAKKQAEAERISTQLGDFYSLFPDTAIDTLPDDVWEDVKKGNSLAASYAIYQRKMQLQAERINAINQKNASLSAGKAGTNTASEFYTPDEVRAMSQDQVRANYSKIIRSMKKWN